MARSFLFVALLATLAITASAGNNPDANPDAPGTKTFWPPSTYTIGGITWKWKAGLWCTAYDPVTGQCTEWGGNNWGFWWPVKPVATPTLNGPITGAGGDVYQLCTAGGRRTAVAGGCSCDGAHVISSAPVFVNNAGVWECGPQSLNPSPPGNGAVCNAWRCICDGAAAQAWAYCV